MRFLSLLICLVAPLGIEPAWSAPEFDRLLPETTKGYVSFPSVSELRARWSETQLGQLIADPVMEPFTSGLQTQVREKLINSRFHISLDVEQLMDICGGELCLATIAPANEENGHAAVIVVNVKGNRDAAISMLDDAAKQLNAKGGQRTVEKLGDEEVVLYTLPRERGQIETPRVVRILAGDILVLGNHVDVCVGILKRLQAGESTDTLTNVPAYQRVMSRVAEAADGSSEAQIRWFIDPFDYAQVIRNARRGPKKRRKDMLAILRTQGFDAVQGIGGTVSMSTGAEDFLHRTFVFAPGDPDAEHRFTLAARMLDFPNQDTWEWPEFIPRDLATAMQLRWNVRQAFEYSSTLVDAIAGDENFFEDLLSSIKDDPNGPQIDVRQDFVKFLGDRVVLISDHVFPITPSSERMLFAISVTDELAIRAAVQKVLDTDPDAVQHVIEGTKVWEYVQEDTPNFESLDIDGIDLIGPEADEEPVDDGERLLPNAAITVAHGYFIVATHLTFLERILAPRAEGDHLSSSEDALHIDQNLKRVGAASDSFRFFSRTDEEYRPSYELIRQGKMPESESMLGRVLNRILGPEDDDVLRQQSIDGSKLPEFDRVRRYLGPSGLYSRTEADGWFCSGVVLDKQAAVAANDEEADVEAATAEVKHVPTTDE